MPQSAEIYTYIYDWLPNRIMQLIHSASVTQGQVFDERALEKMVNVEEINHLGPHRHLRLGAKIEIDMRALKPAVREHIQSCLAPVAEIPEVSITKSEDKITIDAHIATAELPADAKIMSAPDDNIQAVKLLGRLSKDGIDRAGQRLVTDVVFPKRIQLLSAKVSGDGSPKVTVERAEDNDAFNNRILVKTSDASDPLWQAMHKQAATDQRSQLSGQDLKSWHHPFVFGETKGTTDSFAGPVPAVRKVLDAVGAKIDRSLPPLKAPEIRK